MPRGVRGSTNYANQIQKLDEKIERYARIITDLKAQRQELAAKQRDNDMQELYGYMKNSGMTARDILSRISDAGSLPAGALAELNQPEEV